MGGCFNTRTARVLLRAALLQIMISYVVLLQLHSLSHETKTATEKLPYTPVHILNKLKYENVPPSIHLPNA